MARRHGRDEDARFDPAGDSEPIDLDQVWADDAFLDALGEGAPRSGGPDQEADLARVLSAWKQEVDAEPVPTLVNTDEALDAVARARRPRRRRIRLAPVAAAATIVVLGAAGVGLGAHSAEPGDRLFALTKVLYSNEAQSEQAAERVQSELEQASSAVVRGNVDQAQESLQAAQRQLDGVDADPEDRADLEAKIQELLEKVRERFGDTLQTQQTEQAQPPPADEPDGTVEQQDTTSTPSASPSPEPSPSEQQDAGSTDSGGSTEPTPSNPPTESATSTPAPDGTSDSADGVGGRTPPTGGSTSTASTSTDGA